MKINHVSLTLFAWDNIPPTQYHAASRQEGGSSALGLLRIGTDAGIEGHAFLGKHAAKPPAFLDTVWAYKVLDVAAREGRPNEVEVQVIALGDEVAWV